MDKMNLTLWDGNPNTIYETNLSNYNTIQNFINSWNNSDNDFIEPVSLNLNTTNYGVINRQAYSQFLDNAQAINNLLPKMVDENRVADYDYTLSLPVIPTNVAFDKDRLNNYWNDVMNIFNWIIDQVNIYEK